MSDYPIMEQLGFENGDVFQIHDSRVDNISSVDVANTMATRYYVDGTNGDDTNDGLTSSTAFRTIDRFFEIAKKGKLDIRCYIISGGVYNVSPVSTYASIGVHITAGIPTLGGEIQAVPNVIVNFQTVEGRNLGWYQCHVNIQGTAFAPITIQINGGMSRINNMYFDSGSYWFRYCVFTNNLTGYGCGGNIRDCILVGLQLWYSKVRCQDVTFNYDGLSGDNDDYYLFRMYDTDFYISGGDSRINIVQDGSNFAVFRGCRLAFDRNFGSDGGTGTCTSGTWLFDCCVIPINQARFTGLKNRCPNINYGDSVNIIGLTNTETGAFVGAI